MAYLLFRRRNEASYCNAEHCNLRWLIGVMVRIVTVPYPLRYSNLLRLVFPVPLVLKVAFVKAWEPDECNF